MTERSVAIIGKGMIGISMAVLFTGNGIPTIVLAKNAEVGLEKYRTYYRDLVGQGLVTERQAAACERRLSFTESYQDLADVEIVFECVTEKLAVKYEVYRQIEANCPHLKAIASTTSAISPADLAKGVATREKVMVAHPYNPPHLIPLVELTSGDKTDPALLRLAYDFYQSIGKEAVLLRRECPGFIANRLQLALYREVQDLVMRGVCSVEDADKALVYGPGLRWAIFGHNMIMQLGNPDGLTGMVNMLGNSGDRWLADMASWTHQPDNWAEVAQPGVDEEMKHFPDHIGHTNEACAAYRDQMLIELLKLHKKL